MTDPRIKDLQQQLGLVDDCAECNMIPVIGVFLDMAENGGLDTKAIQKQIGNTETTPEEWMALLRESVSSCDLEHKDTCAEAGLVLEALEQKLEEMDAPFARSKMQEITVKPKVALAVKPNVVKEKDTVALEPAKCDPRPMGEWMKEDDPDVCRPCVLPVTMSWYYNELNERGLETLAQELDQVKDTGDPQKVAETLDSIKERAGPDVAERLREFDCATQQFDPTEQDVA